MHKTYVRKTDKGDMHSHMAYCTGCVWKSYDNSRQQSLASAAMHRKLAAGGAAAASVHKIEVYAPGTHWGTPERPGQNNWWGRCKCGSWASKRQPDEDAVRAAFATHYERVTAAG